MMKSAFLILLFTNVISVSAMAVTEQASPAPTVAEATAVVSPTETKLAEDQIPLNMPGSKKTVEAASGSTRVLFTAFVIITLLATAYYFVRKYKLSNNINKSNMQIKVLAQHYLGPKKSLAIIRVSGESILIGVTDSNISMIKSLSLIDDEVPQEAPQKFSDSLKQQDRQPNETGMVDELDEEFSFAGIKDSVSKKIKSMRSFS